MTPVGNVAGVFEVGSMAAGTALATAADEEAADEGPIEDGPIEDGPLSEGSGGGIGVAEARGSGVATEGIGVERGGLLFSVFAGRSGADARPGEEPLNEAGEGFFETLSASSFSDGR